MPIKCMECNILIIDDDGPLYYVFCETCTMNAREAMEEMRKAASDFNDKVMGIQKLVENSHKEEIEKEHREVRTDLDGICGDCTVHVNGVANYILCGGCPNLPQRKLALHYVRHKNVVIRDDSKQRSTNGV